jgi:hypothetical protein
MGQFFLRVVFDTQANHLQSWRKLLSMWQLPWRYHGRVFFFSSLPEYGGVTECLCLCPGESSPEPESSFPESPPEGVNADFERLRWERARERARSVVFNLVMTQEWNDFEVLIVLHVFPAKELQANAVLFAIEAVFSAGFISEVNAQFASMSAPV